MLTLVIAFLCRTYGITPLSSDQYRTVMGYIKNKSLEMVSYSIFGHCL